MNAQPSIGGEADDPELVRRLQRGDAEALERFLARHRSRLLRLALFWSGDRADAEDAVQEALLRGVTGLGALRFARRPLAWLVGTLRNVCREQARRRQRDARLGRRLALEDAPTAEGPGAHVELERAAKTLRRALAELPERQRDALVLRRFEQLSIEDAARVMGRRPGTIKALVHQAEATLKRRLPAQPDNAREKAPGPGEKG